MLHGPDGPFYHDSRPQNMVICKMALLWQETYYHFLIVAQTCDIGIFFFNSSCHFRTLPSRTHRSLQVGWTGSQKGYSISASRLHSWEPLCEIRNPKPLALVWHLLLTVRRFSCEDISVDIKIHHILYRHIASSSHVLYTKLISLPSMGIRFCVAMTGLPHILSFCFRTTLK